MRWLLGVSLFLLLVGLFLSKSFPVLGLSVLMVSAVVLIAVLWNDTVLRMVFFYYTRRR